MSLPNVDCAAFQQPLGTDSESFCGMCGRSKSEHPVSAMQVPVLHFYKQGNTGTLCGFVITRENNWMHGITMILQNLTCGECLSAWQVQNRSASLVVPAPAIYRTFAQFGPQSIAAGGKCVLEFSPQVVFNIRGLSYVGPPGAFYVSDLQIGQRIVSPGRTKIPAEALRPVFQNVKSADKYRPEELFYVPVDLPALLPNMSAQVKVESRLLYAADFCLVMFGEALH